MAIAYRLAERLSDFSRGGCEAAFINIAVTIPEESRPRQLEVVTDWTRELERLVPRDGR